MTNSRYPENVQVLPAAYVYYLSALSSSITTGISDTDNVMIPAMFSHPSVHVFATARARTAISIFLVFISVGFKNSRPIFADRTVFATFVAY